MSRDIRVYIAGPLSGKECNYIKNLNRMVKEAIRVHSLGVTPYVPGLDFMLGLIAGDWNYKDYYDINMAWLKVSHCIYAYEIDSENGGVLGEVQMAEQIGIPVFFTFSGLETWVKEKIEDEAKKKSRERERAS